MPTDDPAAGWRDLADELTAEEMAGVETAADPLRTHCYRISTGTRSPWALKLVDRAAPALLRGGPVIITDRSSAPPHRRRGLCHPIISG